MNKHILDNLNTCIIVLDKTLVLQYMNVAAEHVTATSFHQAKNHSLKQLFHMPESWFKEIMQTFISQQGFTQREVDVVLEANQQHITIDYTVMPFIEEASAADSLLFEFHAIDRILRISREEALMSSEQTSRSLIRGLAHEIKNPLGGIRGSAQLLSRKLSQLKTEGLQEYTDIIIEEADRLRNLVDQLLGPNKPFQMKLMNIHEVMERVFALVDMENSEASDDANKTIIIERQYDPSIPEFQGDKEQLIQALLNVVRNAMQALMENTEYFSQKSEQRRIILKTRTQRQFTIGQQQHRLVCCIEVIDNGSGIPTELLNDIFHPMISGRAEGTGLGLAIAQSIVVQHHGLIECDSHTGETRFSIYLPLDNILNSKN